MEGVGVQVTGLDVVLVQAVGKHVRHSVVETVVRTFVQPVEREGVGADSQPQVVDGDGVSSAAAHGVACHVEEAEDADVCPPVADGVDPQAEEAEEVGVSQLPQVPDGEEFSSHVAEGASFHDSWDGAFGQDSADVCTGGEVVVTTVQGLYSAVGHAGEADA